MSIILERIDNMTRKRFDGILAGATQSVAPRPSFVAIGTTYHDGGDSILGVFEGRFAALEHLKKIMPAGVPTSEELRHSEYRVERWEGVEHEVLDTFRLAVGKMKLGFVMNDVEGVSVFVAQATGSGGSRYSVGAGRTLEEAARAVEDRYPDSRLTDSLSPRRYEVIQWRGANYSVAAVWNITWERVAAPPA